MSKIKKYIWYIVLYYVLYCFLFYTIKNNDNNIYIITFLPLIISISTYYLNKYIKIKNNNKVKSVSNKYKKILKINEKYKFYELNKKDRIIFEREYSHKSYDRARANSILLYHIENNENNIREFILNAYRNKKMYDEYLKEIEQITDKTDSKIIEKIGFSEEKFNKIEKRIIDEIIINESIYDISINVVVSYITNSGKYSYKKNKIVKYQELCDIYMQWRNSKKYDETSKRERKYMNDKLRYDVIKRDGFKCKKCGISAKDGAKLHVDHIIPVSKGGKTTISNLQTLCDRCNLGKSDKSN